MATAAPFEGAAAFFQARLQPLPVSKYFYQEDIDR
jgi:hypothetical protein